MATFTDIVERNAFTSKEAIEELYAMCRDFNSTYEDGNLWASEQALWGVATALIQVRNAEEALQSAWGKYAVALLECGLQVSGRWPLARGR